ncbi:translation initiation factor IF-2-like [Nymphalis io]|uniref:translation initiation factor IF-2-like n=1 Tax=Inachis io TaxID=171585 RepID=UPI002169DB88|nr:translation initiation factor IF-2-like [Nymphalis io]XP_050344467.1 translation initiation factor IF-2-like [Nymphalis io]XP_050344477.1 translation initiation factor IF-2-like [Nymphalis io]XP_050344485.1 translation initiation factor IF-2-like [Nymphalis io]
MTRVNLIFALVCVVLLTIAEAELRERRSPQFSQASASATSFGGNRYPPRPGFGGPGFGRPGPGFGIGRPGGNFQGPGGFGRGPSRGFGPNIPGRQGVNINIAKSVSISTGGRGTSLSQATANSRG